MIYKQDYRWNVISRISGRYNMVLQSLQKISPPTQV